MEKMPPISKIYEAYSCLADHRIEMSENEAKVTSSDYKKIYTIKWKDSVYSSNDNASYWQGYPGYPVLTVLMIQNKLDYNKEILPLFKNINWHELNLKHKKDYDKAIEEVLQTMADDKKIIVESTEKTYEILKKMSISIKKKI
ncbi:MAG: hypothetical protein HFJ02_02720 [Bacilli bacterium]|nr:hypothetical protein [Bacilli bacterium]